MWTYQASWMHLVQPTNETPQYQKIKKWPSQNKSLACRTSTEHVAATNIVYRWFFNNGLFPTLSHILAVVFNHLPSTYFTTWLMLSFNIFSSTFVTYLTLRSNIFSSLLYVLTFLTGRSNIFCSTYSQNLKFRSNMMSNMLFFNFLINFMLCSKMFSSTLSHHRCHTLISTAVSIFSKNRMLHQFVF